jgi:hypothetical protein
MPQLMVLHHWLENQRVLGSLIRLLTAAAAAAAAVVLPGAGVPLHLQWSCHRWLLPLRLRLRLLWY